MCSECSLHSDLQHCFFFPDLLLCYVCFCIFGSILGDDNSMNRDEADGECIEAPSPSCGDYVMHFLTLFWKLLFAFIPPTGSPIQMNNIT